MNFSAGGRAPLLDRIFAGHHDVLAALRSLRRSPSFVAIAVVSLGLAIGLNTTTYALLDAIRRPYVPYDRPDDLFTVRATAWGRNRQSLGRDMSLAMFNRPDLYESVAPWGWHGGPGVIEANGHVVRGFIVVVGPDLFRVLGVKAEAGRLFNADAGESAGDPPAIIAYTLWRQQFALSPRLDRMTVSIGASVHQVIGVMPPAMEYPGGALVWLPMSKAVAGTFEGLPIVEALIRIRPGDTRQRVKTQFDALAGRFASDYRAEKAMFDYRVDPVRPEPRSLGSLHFAMAGTSLLVLIVACLNLANLILARGIGRRREVAVRMAIGASSGAITRYVLAECAVLGAAGGLWGVMLSLWGIQLAEHNMPRQLVEMGFLTPHLQWRVLAFGMLATIATVLVSGLGPALQARRANVSEAMKDGGATTVRSSRTYSLLVIGEVGLSLVVLMCAGLLLRAAREVSRIKWGYDATHMYVSFVSPSRAICPRDDTLSTYLTDLADRVAGVSGVKHATVVSNRSTPRHLVTSDQAEPIEAVLLGYDVVTPDYFRTYDVAVTEGRDFEPGDVRTSGAAIINWSLAARLWPLESPIGRAIKLGPSVAKAPWVRVVGIIGKRPQSGRDSTIQADPQLTVVKGGGCQSARVMVRATDDSAKTPVAVYHALRAGTPGGYVSPLDSPVSGHRADVAARFVIAFLFTAFGLFALTLSVVGIYGVLNYTVGQRLREFATRIALGALPSDLLRIVMHDALVMVLAGTGIGAFGALAFGFVLDDHWLKGIGPTDVIALVGAEALIIGVSLLACLGPAARAARADLVELLRAT